MTTINVPTPAANLDDESRVGSPADEPQIKRWTIEEYESAIGTGIFDGQRLELLDGELIQMSPMYPPHARGIRLVQRALLKVFLPDHYTLQIQMPMKFIGANRPEPDIAVLAGPAEAHFDHPSTALLIVEVAHSSVEYDQKRKANKYAENGIADYWIVNIPQRQVEVYRNIAEQRYSAATVHKPGEAISPLAMPTASIGVADLLP